MKRHAVAFLICISWLVAGCNSNIRPASETPTAQDMMSLKSILSQCSSPCWYGIEPGVTNSYDARGLIAQAYGQDSIDQTENVSIVWNMPQDHVRGFVAVESDFVDSVSVFFDDDKFTVGQVIEEFGEPQFIKIEYRSFEKATCWAYKLMFPNIRVLATVPQNEEEDFDASQYISTLAFTRRELTISTIFGGGTWVVKWKGYINYCALRPS